MAPSFQRERERERERERLRVRLTPGAIPPRIAGTAPCASWSQVPSRTDSAATDEIGAAVGAYRTTTKPTEPAPTNDRLSHETDRFKGHTHQTHPRRTT